MTKEQEDRFHDYLAEIYSLIPLNLDPQPLLERIYIAYLSNAISDSHYDYLLREFEIYSAGLPK